MYSDYFMPLNKESILHEYGANKAIEIDLLMQEQKIKNKSNIYGINQENFNYRIISTKSI